MKRTLVLFLLLSSTTLGAQTVSVDEYRHRLTQLKTRLAAGDLKASKEQAAAIIPLTVDWSGQTLHTDEAILQPITTARTTAELRIPLRQVTTLLTALGRVESSSITTDLALSESIASSHKATELKRGGEISTTVPLDETMLEFIVERIDVIWEWLAHVLERFFDWILDFWPKPLSKNDGGTFFGMRPAVLAVVTAIVLLLLFLAFDILRRSRKRRRVTTVVATAEVRQRDEDPMSREANEWERYALELAASGRIREAIRAWYHAVLVALYRGGILHYRKGRTNWEYVSALPADLSWRQSFIAMTRTFEREWYGRDRSNIEALEACARDARGILERVRGRS